MRLTVPCTRALFSAPCSEQLAEQSESVPSVDNLEFVMESLALGHTVLDQKTVRGGGWAGVGRRRPLTVLCAHGEATSQLAAQVRFQVSLSADPAPQECLTPTSVLACPGVGARVPAHGD